METAELYIITKIPKKLDQVTTVRLQDLKAQVKPDSCDKIDKQLKASQSRSRDLECPPTTLPTCYQCSRYPPGCTILECRLEADRPVVRIVQVPAEATAQNSCLPGKIRSTFDLSSRITSRREDLKQRTGSIDVCSRNRIADKFILFPASHIKSQDCGDDSVALTDKIPKTVSAAILEIDRGEKQADDTISKIVCHPMKKSLSSKKILETSFCDDRSRNQPVIFIERAATSCKDPLTITKNVLCQKSKVIGSPSGCKIACPSDQKIDIFSEKKDPFSQMTCRNGLDPSDDISSSSKKFSKRFKRRICPTYYCKPVRQSAVKEVCKDFLRAKSSASDAISLSTLVGKADSDQQCLDELERPTSERMLRTEVARAESAKSDKAFACQRSATAFRHACSIPRRISEDTSRLSSSQELLARYKEHIPIHLLERYQTCRSKRNGLQDECVMPFLQSVLKKAEQRHTLDNCIESKRNVDRLDEDQNGMSESMNDDQTEVLYLA